MSKARPTVQKFMSTNVQTIPSTKTLKEAVKLMELNKIHHLPVMHEGEVVGILSDRDIKMALDFTGTNADKTLVKDICKTAVYQVEPDMALDVVADAMALKHYGSVLVVQNKKLVGILTMIDMCRALSTIINERFH